MSGLGTKIIQTTNILDVVILISPSPAAGGGSLSHVLYSSLSAPPSKRTALFWTQIILVQSDTIYFSTFP